MKATKTDCTITISIISLLYKRLFALPEVIHFTLRNNWKNANN